MDKKVNNYHNNNNKYLGRRGSRPQYNHKGQVCSLTKCILHSGLASWLYNQCSPRGLMFKGPCWGFNTLCLGFNALGWPPWNSPSSGLPLLLLLSGVQFELAGGGHISLLQLPFLLSDGSGSGTHSTAYRVPVRSVDDSIGSFPESHPGIKWGLAQDSTAVNWAGASLYEKETDFLTPSWGPTLSLCPGPYKWCSHLCLNPSRMGTGKKTFLVGIRSLPSNMTLPLSLIFLAVSHSGSSCHITLASEGHSSLNYSVDSSISLYAT